MTPKRSCFSNYFQLSDLLSNLFVYLQLQIFKFCQRKLQSLESWRKKIINRNLYYYEKPQILMLHCFYSIHDNIS